MARSFLAVVSEDAIAIRLSVLVYATFVILSGTVHPTRDKSGRYVPVAWTVPDRMTSTFV
jgi:hypothetical protein